MRKALDLCGIDHLRSLRFGVVNETSVLERAAYQTLEGGAHRLRLQAMHEWTRTWTSTSRRRSRHGPDDDSNYFDNDE